ncbi:putative disease resistance protein RGA3 [Citrus sinensis]|uniref:putative disease resistance protein RGA3 n=1 Tax=Citrus sinensis TaxID=2711 RepID=UPI0022791964|nr:putative disease resistance protein RGA3 [Citrus sinensis]
MEDVLDEWSTARLKLKINGVDALVCLEKVCSFFPAASCFGCNPLVLCRDIALKVREINESLDDIAKQKDQFGFAVNVIKSNERADERVPSISSIDESEIFGREKEKSELVNRLLCESSKEQKGPCVISLVGMGGIGKTTLAQFAYNNDDVKKNFEERIWVCVSEAFDVFRIARAIIEALTYSSSNFVEFQSLMQHIQKHVAGKKLLLVLDDVWNEDFYKWEQFYNCLKTCLHGSKILITTRKETVARIMGSADIISVNVLSETECWLVFESLGFSGKSMEERENLEKIGREIIRKCKGLPLVAKTIASLLRSKNTEKEWQNILESEIWEIEEVEKNLLAPLLLSYNELPSKVKQCFTYCAIFPKNSKIWKDKLIELWMAQGFLNNKRSKEMEEIGEEYFNILASRSFFQDFERGYDGKIYQCKVHDIVHDFAQFLCRKECLMVEILCGEEQLPQGIGKLRKLMYLDNDYTNSLRYLPVGIRELIRLRRVRKFVVGGGYDRACSLESLKRLILLRECRIHGLGDVSDVGEARRAELEKKKNLFDLELRFDCTINEEQERRDDEEDEQLLEALQPPPNLKKL